MIWLESHKTKNKILDFWFLAYHLKKIFSSKYYTISLYLKTKVDFEIMLIKFNKKTSFKGVTGSWIQFLEWILLIASFINWTLQNFIGENTKVIYVRTQSHLYKMIKENTLR